MKPHERIYQIVKGLGAKPNDVNALVISIIQYLNEEWERNRFPKVDNNTMTSTND